MLRNLDGLNYKIEVFNVIYIYICVCVCVCTIIGFKHVYFCATTFFLFFSFWLLLLSIHYISNKHSVLQIYVSSIVQATIGLINELKLEFSLTIGCI